jgi:hypothetical protein
LLLILTHESPENLARIWGLKSESRFSREFQEVILLSTILARWGSTLTDRLYGNENYTQTEEYL